MEITIGARKIGVNHPPFLIAELSGNHNKSLERAFELIHVAKEAGADAIKLQTYTADTITWPSTEEPFQIREPSSLWNGRSLYDLYQEASLPWEWHQSLFDLCAKLGIICFSTPFDESAVDFLEGLTTAPPCYKIASPEIVDLPLIRRVAATGKPLIMSTGAATFNEVAEAVACARLAGCIDLILLKCTAAYPSQPSDSNLHTIPHLATAFHTVVGLSDHTLGTAVSVASVALGCCMIEKHLTLRRSDGGVDSAFSMEPAEFKLLAADINIAWQALGPTHYGPLPSERVAHSHRPSLFFIEDLQAGHIVREENLRTLRPALGLPPRDLEAVVGLRLAHCVEKGTPVSWRHFKSKRT